MPYTLYQKMCFSIIYSCFNFFNIKTRITLKLFQNIFPYISNFFLLFRIKFFAFSFSLPDVKIFSSCTYSALERTISFSYTLHLKTISNTDSNVREINSALISSNSRTFCLNVSDNCIAEL